MDTLAPVRGCGCDQVSPGPPGGRTSSAGLCAAGPSAPVTPPDHVPSCPQPEPPERQEGPDPEGAAGAAAPDHLAALLPAALPVLRPLLRVRTSHHKWHRPGQGEGSRALAARPPSRLPFLPPSSDQSEHPLCAVLGAAPLSSDASQPDPASGPSGHQPTCAGVKEHWPPRAEPPGWRRVGVRWLSSLDPRLSEEAFEVQRGWAPPTAAQLACGGAECHLHAFSRPVPTSPSLCSVTCVGPWQTRGSLAAGRGWVGARLPKASRVTAPGRTEI